MPRSTYPRDALVRMAVDLRNVSHETFVVPTPCPADNPVAQVIGRHGAVVYPPALPSEPATASSCQMQPPPEPLPPGGVIKGYSYVVLRNGIVRAAADVQLIPRGISHSSATVVHLATPPVRVRLVRGHAPRITFTGPPALHAYVHGVPARDRGPLLYMDWYTCKDSQATTVGGHVTMWTPAPQSPILVPGCHQPAQWHVVAGWVGQPVAYLNYVGGFSARQE